MIVWWCLFLCSIIIKFSSAQAIPYGVPNRSINNANNARGIPNSMTMGRGLPNGMATASNQFVRNTPMTANNIAKSNFVNPQNMANPYYPNNYLANNLNNANKINPNMVNTNIANINSANANLAGTNFGNNVANIVTNPVLASANQVLANDMNAAAIENLASANLIPNVGTPIIANMANGIKPNAATFNFGNNAIPITVTGRSLDNQPVGIRVLADNLEVSGTVSVVGRMPIYGAVTINGNVPTDGKASVKYSCGSPTAV